MCFKSGGIGKSSLRTNQWNRSSLKVRKQRTLIKLFLNKRPNGSVAAFLTLVQSCRSPEEMEGSSFLLYNSLRAGFCIFLDLNINRSGVSPSLSSTAGKNAQKVVKIVIGKNNRMKLISRQLALFVDNGSLYKESTPTRA